MDHNQYRHKCRLCSHRQTSSRESGSVYHTHFSTKFLRQLVGPNWQDPVQYSCPTCKVSHASQGPTERIKILVSNSIMHQYWLPKTDGVQYEGDSLHIDQITIPGGLVEELRLAFMVDFDDDIRGLDVILVAGTDDVLSGQYTDRGFSGFTGTHIVADFKRFKETVLDQARRCHPEISNTFAIATIPSPPSLCHLPDEGPLPNPDFVDHYEMMKWLNDEIRKLNRDTQQLGVPTFHNFGIRVDNKEVYDCFGNMTLQKTTKFRRGDWKGVTFEEKFHLSDKLRMKMGRHILKYFSKNC